MKVVIVTSGSRGDVQPYIILGLELQSRGHQVILATEERMQSLVEDLAGGLLQYARISGDPTGMLFEKKYQCLLAKGSILPVMRATEEHNKPVREQVLSDIAAACEGAELILSGPLTLTPTMCMAQMLGVPWVPVCLGPVMPTAEFPSWAISNSPFRWKWLNKATYSFIFWALWKQESGRINAWRQASLGLPALPHGAAGVLDSCPDIPVVMMCSSHLIPGLRPPADWGSRCHLTGFAFPADTPSEAVDQRLRHFIESDSDNRPLYLGFGSMPAPEPRTLLQLAIDVVKNTQMRAVLVAGWSDLSSLIGDKPGQLTLPEKLLLLPSAPHAWLLPRCCLAVHHAGVGTCGAVLRAGIPSVPCPVMLDQPFQAARLVEAGVASEPLPFHRMTTEELCARIQHVLSDSAMQTRAATITKEVATYGGVAAAADIALQATSPWGGLNEQ